MVEKYIARTSMGCRRDKSLPQYMEALRAEPPLAAFTY